MVIARHHVLGAKVQEGDQVHPPDFLNITRVAFGDVMAAACVAIASKVRIIGSTRRPHRLEVMKLSVNIRYSVRRCSAFVG